MQDDKFSLESLSIKKTSLRTINKKKLRIEAMTYKQKLDYYGYRDCIISKNVLQANPRTNNNCLRNEVNYSQLF